MLDELEEAHVKILKKLLTDKADSDLNERRLFEGALDHEPNEEFGDSGIFGDKKKSTKLDLENFLKSHLQILTDEGVVKASQLPG